MHNNEEEWPYFEHELLEEEMLEEETNEVEPSNDFPNPEPIPRQYADYTKAFEGGDVFPDRESLVKWVRQVGYSQGHVLKILRSDGKGIGKKERVTMSCEREGVYKKHATKYVTGSKKSSCPFKLRGRPSALRGGWTVRVLCGFHNHDRCASLFGHAYPGRPMPEELEKIITLTKAGAKPSEIMVILKADNPNNYTSLLQIYNIRRRWWRSIRHPRTQMQHLLKRLRDEGYETWYRKDEETNVLKQILWAHPTSIRLLNSFSIVLIIDNTYKTCRYKWPLLEVVGQTSTDRTFTVAFSYMEFEQLPNFLWALERVRELIVDVDLMPKVIVTDFEGALVKAVEQVFPTSTHLLCQFHIKKNIKTNLKKYVSNLDDEDLLIEAWKNLVHSKDEQEYETRLSEFEDLCKYCITLFEYVNRVYLAQSKEKFVDAWVHKSMHLGNTTSNR